MERVCLNQWFMKENDFSISLTNFFVKIKIKSNGRFLFFPLTVVDHYGRDLVINFNSLEEAVSFTEKVINQCITVEEIDDRYKKALESAEESTSTNAFLTPEEIDEAISFYYESSRMFVLSYREGLQLQDEKNDLIFHLEICDEDGNRYPVSLNKDKMKEVLSFYLGFYGYDLLDFQYVGVDSQLENYWDYSVSHYKGVQSNIKRSNNVLTFRKV